MEFVFKIVLIIHIIAGCISLSTGTINLFRKKGDTLHRKVGIFFFISMIVSAIAGFILALLHTNVFLLIMAVFSFYLTTSGQRYLKLKRIDKGQEPKVFDWMLTLTMAVFAVAFILYGFYEWANNNTIGIVLLVFGSISMLMVKKDFTTFRGTIIHRNYWIMLHIQRMTAAYIASLTAFLVVNNTYLPALVAWLLPTVIFTPLIIYWSKKYTHKMIKR